MMIDVGTMESGHTVDANVAAYIARLAHEPSLGHYYIAEHAKSRAREFIRARAEVAEAVEGDVRRCALDASTSRDVARSVARADIERLVRAFERCAVAVAMLAKNDE